MKTQRKSKASKGFYIIALAVLVGAGILTAVNSKDSQKPKETAPKTSSFDTAELNSKTEDPIIDETPSSIISLPSEESATTSESEEPEEAQTTATTEIVSFQIPIDGTIIKQFDLERHQYSKTFGDMRRHSGIDILAVAGTPALITANGTVKSITQDPMMGTVVTLSHAGGYESVYCGLEEIKYSEGDAVKIGNVLGVVGEIPSECLDEDHLHFEIKKDGNSFSPLEAFDLL